MTITDILGAPLLEGISKLIGQFKASPEDKAKLQELIQENSAQFAQLELDANVKLNQIASDNIKVESSSSDWFVRRCRPAVVWCVTLTIFFNYFIPNVNHLFHGTLQPIVLDPSIVALFGTIVTGYVVARTVEKHNDKD